MKPTNEIRGVSEGDSILKRHRYPKRGGVVNWVILHGCAKNQEGGCNGSGMHFGTVNQKAEKDLCGRKRRGKPALCPM